MTLEEEHSLDAEAVAKSAEKMIDLAQGVYEKSISVDFPNDDGNPCTRIKYAIGETLRAVESMYPLYAENEEGSSCLDVVGLAEDFYARVNS